MLLTEREICGCGRYNGVCEVCVWRVCVRACRCVYVCVKGGGGGEGGAHVRGVWVLPHGARLLHPPLVHEPLVAHLCAPAHRSFRVQGLALEAARGFRAWVSGLEGWRASIRSLPAKRTSARRHQLVGMDKSSTGQRS